jgi:hypothetical protein
MNHQALSFTEMSAEEVVRRAKNMIERIDKSRLAERKQALDVAREEARTSFFRRLFRRPMPTDEQLIQELREDFWNSYNASYISYGLQRDKAEQLLRLSQSAREDGSLAKIYVTADDLTALTD